MVNRTMEADLSILHQEVMGTSGDDIRTASIDPQNRIVLTSLFPDSQLMSALPFDTSHIFLNEGHSAMFFKYHPDYEPVGTEVEVFEVVRPSLTGSFPTSQRFIRLDTASLASSPDFQTNREFQEFVLSHLNQEMAHLGYTYLAPEKLDEVVVSITANGEQIDGLNKITAFQVANCRKPYKRIQLQSIRNFIRTCQTSGVPLDVLPYYPAVLEQLEKSEQIAEKIAVLPVVSSN